MPDDRQTVSYTSFEEMLRPEDQTLIDLDDDLSLVTRAVQADEDAEAAEMEARDAAFIGPMPEPAPYVHSTDAPAWVNDPRPQCSIPSLTMAALKHIVSEHGSIAWNLLMMDMRAELGDDWGPDFSHANFSERGGQRMDFKNANFTDCRLDYCSFRECDMTNANFSGASLYDTRFIDTDVTGSDYKQGLSYGNAQWSGDCAGYVAPLPDISREVALHYLREAINDPDSFVNVGLSELREGGLRAEWRGHQLHFWFSAEIHKCRNLCDEGECDCETEHACQGDCDCCACYTGNCDCQPDHEYDTFYPTGDIYLASVIGQVDYSWNNGLYGDLKMSPSSMHPHISTSGALCLGDAEMPRTMQASDFIVMLLGWAPGHNPSSEYRDIEELPLLT